jgi:hypothetical protein
MVNQAVAYDAGADHDGARSVWKVASDVAGHGALAFLEVRGRRPSAAEGPAASSTKRRASFAAASLVIRDADAGTKFYVMVAFVNGCGR